MLYFKEKQTDIIEGTLGWKLGFFIVRVTRVLKGQNGAWGDMNGKEKRNTLFENMMEFCNIIWGWRGD